MIIEQEFTVDAPRDAVAAFFTDVQRVAGCVPGLEGVEETGPNQYSARLGVRMGPIRASFGGTLRLDPSEAPARLVAVGEGRDRATGSVATVRFTADLTEVAPSSTRVTATADVALRGRMGQYGTGVVRAAAGELVREFAACANATLAAEAVRSAPASPEQAVAVAAPPAAATAGPRRGLLALLVRALLRAARGRLTRRKGGVR
ncbi:MAG TPA: SRPBCC domain-containing protein [Pseudonocardia sp.]|jgi:carbon monoxide dehydrogenase subunit G|uniref:CoxG family protein n=1 Tax=Pseudonocardia sp. TaxID=60912 RepID=UPI002B4B302B|nr:SRPBCC domain-containing protein [Pseudonocardia sp.]HLU58934.1 SRPBCC domain-containing protein [Pseudonocardia sp.]